MPCSCSGREGLYGWVQEEVRCHLQRKIRRQKTWQPLINTVCVGTNPIELIEVLGTRRIITKILSIYLTSCIHVWAWVYICAYTMSMKKPLEGRRGSISPGTRVTADYKRPCVPWETNFRFLKEQPVLKLLNCGSSPESWKTFNNTVLRHIF